MMILEAGYDQTCGVGNDMMVDCWGFNYHGQTDVNLISQEHT